MTGLRRFRTAVNVVRAAQRFGKGAVQSSEEVEHEIDEDERYKTYVDPNTGRSYRYNLTTQSTRWLDVTAAPTEQSELDL